MGCALKTNPAPVSAVSSVVTLPSTTDSARLPGGSSENVLTTDTASELPSRHRRSYTLFSRDSLALSWKESRGFRINFNSDQTGLVCRVGTRKQTARCVSA